jgi:hypothetical protein
VTKLTWPAPERNKQPILEVLERVLPPTGTLLEIASGTGQHAVHLARHLPGWTIQPTDIDPENLASIRAWREEAKVQNLLAPLHLDVCAQDWPPARCSAFFNANLIHIAPPEATRGLMLCAAHHLEPGGTFILYGPFKVAGKHTAPSNEAFDASLRAKDPRFGVRDLEAVIDAASQHGFTLRQRLEMPANNQLMVMT